MSDLDSIKTDLSEKLQNQLDVFQKTVVDSIKVKIQEQIQRSISEVTASSSVDNSTVTNMSHVLEEKFRKEINSDKNFRDITHNRRVDIEKTQKGMSDQSRQLQAAVKEQQAALTQHQDNMTDQIQLFNATIRGGQEENIRAQTNAQASVVTLQELVLTTNTNSQETQRTVAGLATSMAELTKWIQAQTPTSKQSRVRSRFKLPPISASPRRTIEQENDRPQDSPKQVNKKACKQATPKRPNSTTATQTTEHESPNRAKIQTPPSTSRIKAPSPGIGTAHLHNNPFGALAEDDDSEEADILFTQLKKPEQEQKNTEQDSQPTENTTTTKGATNHKSETSDIPQPETPRNHDDRHEYHELTLWGEDHNRESQEVQEDVTEGAASSSGETL
jgi:hypothetical protein